MREETLTDYVDAGGQANLVAKAMGVTKGAITQMITNKRDIRVVLDEHGQPVRAYEIKKFPKAN